jgi:hypothetical protein
MSFFKLEDNQLLEGPNFVESPNFVLVKEEKDTYTYPVEGWYWFDTIEEAQAFFNLPKE